MDHRSISFRAGPYLCGSRPAAFSTSWLKVLSQGTLAGSSMQLLTTLWEKKNFLTSRRQRLLYSFRVQIVTAQMSISVIYLVSKNLCSHGLTGLQSTKKPIRVFLNRCRWFLKQLTESTSNDCWVLIEAVPSIDKSSSWMRYPNVTWRIILSYHLIILLIYHGTTTHLYSCFIYFLTK